MSFGPHAGRMLDEIARDNAGLLYLDRLLAWDGLWPSTREVIRRYLEEPSIARELEKAMGDE